MRKTRQHLLLFLACFLSCAGPLQGLELKRVILSTNDNPDYIQFWPIVAPLWSAMGIKPTLALIAEEDCEIDATLGDVIRFAPQPGIPESLQAQVIRLFLPALFPDEGCIISDIDMLPVSRSFFIDGAAPCPNEAFLVYRALALPDFQYRRYPMCYVAAKGEVFSSVFGVKNREEIGQRIRDWASFGFGWDTDETLLYRYLIEWETSGGDVMRLGNAQIGRIDRGNWPWDPDFLDLSRYVDCHCPRPYSYYKGSIDVIARKIGESLNKD